MPAYIVQSATNAVTKYEVDTDEQTCTCTGFEYCKTDPKWCSHLMLVSAYPQGHALITQVSAL